MQATYFIDYWLHLKFVAEYFEYLRVDTEGSIQVYRARLAIDGAAYVCRYDIPSMANI